MINPEEIKSAAFGASNTTIQIVPQVYEMAVLPPSAPQQLLFDGRLSFCKPEHLGGSRISAYEVHIEDPETGDWLMLQSIPVKHLVSDPDLSQMCQISKLRGAFHIRIAAKNRAGLGEVASLRLVAHGKL